MDELDNDRDEPFVMPEEIAAMGLRDVLETLDVASARLLLARVTLGVATAAEIAQAQTMLKRHGIAVQDKTGTAEALRDKLRARSDKRRLASVTPITPELEEEAARLAGNM
jgi:hypothetical protein